MTDKIKANTVKGIQALLKRGKPGQYRVGRRLYLKVSGPGTGSWVFRYRRGDKTTRVGLGSVHDVSLAQARQKAQEHRAKTLQGLDPLEEKRAEAQAQKAEAVTFEKIARRYIAGQRSSWRGTKHEKQWQNSLESYVFPKIGDRRPAEITTEHILNVLKPIWETRPETARRVRNRIELVLSAAKVQGLCAGGNPAQWRGHLELLLSKRPPGIKHHPALHWGQMQAFWQALKAETGAGAQALRFLILTATRTSEVLLARWEEIDTGAEIWTIPAERAKNGKAHRVPLSVPALELIHELPRTGSPYLFQGRNANRPPGKTAVLNALRKVPTTGDDWRSNDGRLIVPHGFRSTFRDWCAELARADHIVAEISLGHTVGTAVETAYRRGDLLERRRELMTRWGQFVTARPNDAQIIPFLSSADR